MLQSIGSELASENETIRLIALGGAPSEQLPHNG